MSIQKSKEYEFDVKTRRLFGRMHAEIVALNNAIDETLTAANAMRLALGAATLTLAEVEYISVNQSHDKRVADAILFETQTRLTDMLETAKASALQVSNVLTAQVPKVGALGTQAARIAVKDVVDNEPTGPLPGMTYVEITYFKNELSCSVSHIRNLITQGAIPPHDAVNSEDGGRPKFLWLKHKAAVTVERLVSQGAAAGAFN